MILLLNPYLDAVLALGLALIATVLILAIFKSLSGLPGIGGALQNLGHKVAQAIAGACGSIASGVTHLVGVSFHAVAALLNLTWRTMDEATTALVHIARVVGDHVAGLARIEGTVHNAVRALHTLLHRFVQIGGEIGRLRHQLRTFERDITRGIGEDVLPRIRSLDRELGKLRHRVIPKIREIAEGAETDAQTALHKVEGIPFPAGVKTWAEAVAAGLAALGLGWLNCRSNPFSRNPKACNMLGDLSDLLGLIVALDVAVDFDQLVHDAQAVAEVTAEGVRDVFGLSDG